ncbi:MAG: S-layer homology domain-containing protein [Oscillospiraceae bacterium]|nr:S-layer homology domain-containing protein [Oscillospiraceae bacterium]
MTERGVITGKKDEVFSSEETVTNAQLVAMLLKNRYGAMEPINEHWYSGYMDYALRNGIITDLESEFPNAAITRQSAARIIHEMLNKVYNEADDENWITAEALADLYDCHTCVMHVAQVYVKGIMTGSGDGLFRGTDKLTRAQADEAIMRLVEPSLRVPPKQNVNIDNLITMERASELMENGALLVDVRSADDYATGHIKGSISTPIDNIISDPRAAFMGIESDTTIIVYCRRGTNSRRAVQILNEAGYTSVYNLGGIFSEAMKKMI